MTAEPRVRAGRRGRAAGALAGLWALGSLSCAGLVPTRDSAGDQELRRRILELERKAIVAEVEVDRLRQKVATLEAGRPTPAPSSSSPAPQRSIPADGASTSEPRVPPPPTIRANDLADEVVQAPQPLIGAATVPPPLPAGALEPAAPEARTAYDRAFALFNQGLFAEAEQAFRAYLDSYGANELSDNAVYWIGECRLARSDWNGALRAFQNVIERFPTGNKVPDALFKAGQALERLGDVENARASYLMLVERFPESGAGSLARDRLALLPPS